MSETIAKQRKIIFVIMPFTESPSRDEGQLDSFFANELKLPIENAEGLDYAYSVRRSDVTLDITRKIILDLLRADIVIADLSGIAPNPNVMYELGVRLAVSSKPVILIRESHPDNIRVFDVSVFYIHPYDPLKYPALQQHLIQKIRRFETGEEIPESPILRIVGGEAALQQLAAKDLSPDQQRELVLRGVSEAGRLLALTFGPRGGRVAINRPNFFRRFTRRGIEIVDGIGAIPSLEAEGVDAIRRVVGDMERKLGFGGKIAALLTAALVDELERAATEQLDRREISIGMQLSIQVAMKHLSDSRISATPALVRGAVETASQDTDIAAAIVEAAELAGGIEYVGMDFDLSVANYRIAVHSQSGFTFEGALADAQLGTREGTGDADLSNCLVMVTAARLQSMAELLPSLEAAAQRGRPLVIFADSIEGEALATLITNNERQTLRTTVIKLARAGARRLAVLQDVAVLTGARFVNPAAGASIERVTESEFGTAGAIVVEGHLVRIADPGGSQAEIESRLAGIRSSFASLTNDSDRDLLQDRLAGLSGRGAFLSIGGATDNDGAEIRHAAQSGISAYASAERSGVLPGAGVAFLAASRAVEAAPVAGAAQEAGRRAVVAALRAPFGHLAQSCGLRTQEVLAETLKLGVLAGLDVRRSTIIPDVVSAGIVDTEECLQRALQFADSRARDLLETVEWSISSSKAVSE